MHDGEAADAPVRVRLLTEGARITAGDRNRSYGDPVYQLGVAGEFKRLARDYAARSLTDAEWEALDMIFTKISRAIVGGEPGVDTFVDMATYAAIFGECYVRRSEDDEPIRFADSPADGIDSSPSSYWGNHAADEFDSTESDADKVERLERSLREAERLSKCWRDEAILRGPGGAKSAGLPPHRENY